ncbi:MAG: hypothetical protein IPP57_11090 [Candidatus Obscuribacter sp.]|nr:hypothetical protein [Candidatus Obscuribacter sp.]
MIPNLFDRITGIIGEPIESDFFRAFVSDLNTQQIETQIGDALDILFPDYGLEIDVQENIVRSAAIHINTPSVNRRLKLPSAANCIDTPSKHIVLKPYTSTLLSGVLPTDSRQTLFQKLGNPLRTRKSPGSLKSEWDIKYTYELDKIRISFCFEGESGPMDLVSVWLIRSY